MPAEDCPLSHEDDADDESALFLRRFLAISFLRACGSRGLRSLSTVQDHGQQTDSERKVPRNALEGAKQILRDAHDCTKVVELATVLQQHDVSAPSAQGAEIEMRTLGALKTVTSVRSFQNSYPSERVASDQRSVSKGEATARENTRTFDDHMCSADEIEVVLGQKVANDALAEAVAHPSLVVLPVQRRVARIAPQQVVQEAVVWHVRWTRYPPHVVHMRERRRQAAVDTEDLGRDNGGNRQAVEYVDEGLPDLDVAPSLALVVKPVDCGGRA